MYREPPREIARRSEAPVAGAAARDVARAEHQIGARLGGGDQAWHVRRIVREVAVHLEHQLRIGLQDGAETGDVGPAEPFLARRDAGRRRTASSPASRSASSPVPSGEASSITSTRSPGRSTSREREQHRLEVLALVVGGEADGRAHRRAYDRDDGGLTAERGARGAVRPARRPDGARRGGRVPHRRVPQGGSTHPRDVVLGRPARARRAREAAAGHRQDDRGARSSRWSTTARSTR